MNVRMKFVPDNKIALGLDIGGTKLKALALQSPDKILAETVIPSQASEGPNAVRKAIFSCVSYFKDKKIPFQSIGIGCAGSVDHRGGIVRNSPNFAHWKDIPLKDWVTQDTGVPVCIENDANCAVLSECKIGAGQGFENIVLLTLGTGIGGGLILNNQLFRGSTGTAGELGHFSIHADGIECPCGNRGCFERYCSATSVKKKANGISPKEVFSKASENPFYGKIVSEFLDDFQIGLVSIANMFDPDCILLGGAVTEGVGVYLPKLQAWVKNHAFPIVGQHIQIKMTKHGNLSGSLGAALLAIE